MVIASLSLLDFIIFAITLIVSAGIGIFFAYVGYKSPSAKEMLIANRQMTVFPTAMSLMGSFMSGITMLGNPAEVYYYETMFWWSAFAYIMSSTVSGLIFVPLFHNLQLTSVNEYLERRFNKWVKLMACMIFSIQMMIYMSLVLYAPALAISHVTRLDKWISIISIGTVCTFYTTIGGMKAVMWTGVFQVIMMFVGLGAVFIKGIIDFDGIYNVLIVNYIYDRIEFFNFNLNPTTRHTAWGLSFGSFFQWLYVYGVNQSQVQRYLSVPNVKIAQRALFWNILGLLGILSLTLAIGLVVFAKYHDCDPLSSRKIESREELLPFYVMDSLKATAGLPGLFLACLFSAALSTISSGLNSLVAVFLEDVLKGFFTKNITDQKAAKYSKILCLFFGAFCLILTYLASFLEAILQAALSFYGVIGGPLLGLFCLGIFVPFANSKGAIIGTLTSLSFTIWIFSGHVAYGIKYPKKPIYTFGCNATNITVTEDASIQEKSTIKIIHSLSYTWYGLSAVLTSMFIGIIVSLITKKHDEKHVDPALIVSLLDKILPCFPERVRNILNCGYRFEEPRNEPQIPDIELRNTRIATINLNGDENPAFDDFSYETIN